MAETVCELFGGAMSWMLLPGFEDVSQFRQVPDNQEVFAHVNSGACIIIELMARQACDNAQCGEYFLGDLAESNQSKCNVISHPQVQLTTSDVPKIPHDTESSSWSFGCVIGGVQSVSKFTNETGCENEVFVAMGILRFPSPVSCDILVTVTAPQVIAKSSSEMKVLDNIMEPQCALDVLHRLLHTITVHDWGLFVPE